MTKKQELKQHLSTFENNVKSLSSAPINYPTIAGEFIREFRLLNQDKFEVYHVGNERYVICRLTNEAFQY